jgi:hypothetical protein
MYIKILQKDTMKQILFTGCLILIALKGQGQINMNDSTVQVKGYWNKNAQQSYSITHKELNTHGADTVLRASYLYTVDITITDSTANSYTIDWYYRNYEYTRDSDPVIKVLNTIPEGMTITVKTDETGKFQEVINWKEVRDYLSTRRDVVIQYRDTLLQTAIHEKQPESDKSAVQIPDSVFILFDMMSAMLYNITTKEDVEAAICAPILQFFSFHGEQYKLQETYSGVIPLTTEGERIDTYIEIMLERIMPEDNTYFVCRGEELDSQQLRKGAFNRMTRTGTAPSSLDEMPLMKNRTFTGSLIHTSGWVVYSKKTVKNVSESGTSSYECTIELN